MKLLLRNRTLLRACRFLCWAMIVFSLIDCQREDSATPLPDQPRCKSVKEYSEANPNQYTALTYDNLGRLSKLSSYSNGRVISSTTFKYNAKGQLVQRVLQPGESQSASSVVTETNFEYDPQGKLIKTSVISRLNGRTDNAGETEYQYDQVGKCIKVINYYAAYGADTQTVTVFEYNGDNVIKTISNPDTRQERITTYEYYSDKLNNYQGASATASPEQNPTPSLNLLKKTVRNDSFDPVDLHVTEEYTYEYNAEGFPVKVNILRKGGTVSFSETRLIEYQCN